MSAATAAAAPSVYLSVVTASATLRSMSAPAGRRARGGPTRFAVCVPAHDEEAVIAETVDGLRSQRYPSDVFELHVVADNCTDATVAIARARGATVHERIDPENAGKGPALNWLFDRLELAEIDVIVIIDADTVADSDFLAAMSDAFERGARAAQGYYGVLRPETSAAVGLRYAALACRHHLRPLGRCALGGSSGLFGNGMAFDVGLLSERRWSGHLIEDAEFQLEMLLDGIVVEYVQGARVFAEMPASFDDSVSQHQRWELGRMQLVRRFLPELLRRSVRGGRLRRGVYADAAMDQLVPPLAVLGALDLCALTFGVLATSTGRRGGRAACVAGLCSTGALFVHVIAGLVMVKAPRSVYLSLLDAPRLVIWKLGIIKNAARRPDTVVWTRTKRNLKE